MERRPLDINPRGENIKVRAARLYSDIFSPPSVYAIFGFIIAWSQLQFLPGLLHGTIFGALTSLLPIVYILIKLKQGTLTDIHLSQPGERTIPYLLSAFGAFFAYVLFRQMGSPTLFINFNLTVLIGLLALAMINTRWMISAHTASITAVTVFAGYAFGPATAIATSPLILSTAYIRFYLKRHNLVELIAGFLLGVAVVNGMAFFGIFDG